MLKQLVPKPVRARLRQAVWAAPVTRELLFRRLPTDGDVDEVGHRRYVGTQWEEPGHRQFAFMVGRGLQPSHVLVDVACGSLRGGVHFIPYLDAGNYLGLEKEAVLLERGVEHELGRELHDAKRPELVVSDCFAFDRFTKKADLGISVSLFSHLSEDLIGRCLANLHGAANADFAFYATFLTAASRLHRNPPHSHAHAPFRYHPSRIEDLAGRHGFAATRCDDWNDPIADQVMFELRRL